MRPPRFSAPTLLLLPAVIVLAAVVVVPLLLSLLFELHAVPPDQAGDLLGLHRHAQLREYPPRLRISGSPSAAPCCC